MNIAEILKNCPQGTRLYSPLYGIVIFDTIVCSQSCDFIQVLTYEEKYKQFYVNGIPANNCLCKECMLFPSRDQRDWNKFEVPNQSKPKPQFKPFDKVLVRDTDDKAWKCDIFSNLGDKGVFICLFAWWRQCIPYEGNEHLLGTNKKPNNNGK